MIILIPTDDKKRIASHFGHASYFTTYNSVTNELKFEINNLNHNDPKLSPVEQIKENFNPDLVIVKQVGRRAIKLFKEHNIKLKTTDKEIINEIIENKSQLKEVTKDCGH